jgi:hypothetical protein
MSALGGWSAPSGCSWSPVARSSHRSCDEPDITRVADVPVSTADGVEPSAPRRCGATGPGVPAQYAAAHADQYAAHTPTTRPHRAGDHGPCHGPGSRRQAEDRGKRLMPLRPLLTTTPGWLTGDQGGLQGCCGCPVAARTVTHADRIALCGRGRRLVLQAGSACRAAAVGGGAGRPCQVGISGCRRLRTLARSGPGRPNRSVR